jgi:hypothetical protein
MSTIALGNVVPKTPGVDLPRPLLALLSQVLVAFTLELDNAFEQSMAASGYHGTTLSLMVWCILMRFVREDGASVHEIALQVLAPEKRIKFELGCLERWGCVLLQPQQGDDRPVPVAMHRRTGRKLRNGWGSGRGIRSDWIVRPTREGLKAIQMWPTLFDVIEKRWKTRFGDESIVRLRKSLLAVVDQLEIELPHALPSDWPEAEAFPPRVTKSAANLPLPTLLSQLLLEYSIEFGRESPFSLAFCANALRVLGKAPVLGEIPRLTGSSPERTDIGWRLRPYVLVEADPSARRGKRLTLLGLKAQQTYRQLTGEIEKRWEASFGKEEIGRLRENLLGLFTQRDTDGLVLSACLVPPEGVVRAGKQSPALGRRNVGAAAQKRMRDLVMQTQDFVRDPEKTLPHYPLWDMNRGFGP